MIILFSCTAAIIRLSMRLCYAFPFGFAAPVFSIPCLFYLLNFKIAVLCSAYSCFLFFLLTSTVLVFVFSMTEV